VILPSESPRPVRTVVLLNPPGRRLYLRDYYCSKTTKSNYLYAPIDLVVLSGSLARDFEVSVLDALAERLDPVRALVRLRALAPDAIVSLVGAVSWEEDRAFLERAKRETGGALLLATGDVFRERAEETLAENPWIDGALLSFANGDASALLRGEGERVEAAVFREGNRIRSRPFHPLRGSYRVPTPRHDFFPARGYRFSFARRRRFVPMLTDFGCPYPCTFCIMGTLGFATRPVGDVLAELDHARSLGVREIFFLDQTFGVQAERARELCAAMGRRGWSWTAFTRPDRAGSGVLEAMARGGCHTVILGVESADDERLRDYQKGYTTEEVREAFARARRAGLRTVGTFLIGGPEDDEGSFRRAVEFAVELHCDFASFNVAVPRFGTPWRSSLVREGLADPEEPSMDQAGERVAMPTRFLSRAQVLRAKKRAIRSFYLRPSYLTRRVLALRSFHEARSQFAEGLALLARNL
jgi:radical SAM superfamily enzyme YgiQ (UPF0313 family)